MLNKPWMKFYPADWRADQALRVCSLAARGLWIECLCVAHEADRYGHLLINGKPVTHEQLAALTGTPPDQVSALMAELESAGVFSRTASGSIYSRRMTRDEKMARIARQNGQNGGNPTLSNNKRIRTQDNPPDNPPDKGGLKAQSPESRVQNTDPKLRSGSVERAPARKPKVKGTPSRLPDGWHPGQAGIAYAMSVGLTEAQAQSQVIRVQRWAANARGSKGTKLDWFKFWQNWCDRAADDLARNPSSGQARAGPKRFDEWCDAHDELIDMYKRRGDYYGEPEDEPGTYPQLPRKAQSLM